MTLLRRAPRWLMAAVSLLVAAPAVQAMDAGSRADFVIGNIEVRGLQRISEGTVFNYLPVNIGDHLSAHKVRESIRALYATGFFRDVEMRRQGNTLVVVALERPSIESFTVKGNKAIKTKQLMKSLRNVGLAPGKVFDRSVLENVTEYLTDMYYGRGKYGVRIATKVTPESDNRVKIAININEGARAVIRSIDVVGNRRFAKKEALSKKEHRTFVAYGDQGSFGVAEINEDQNAPSSGDSYVQVLNADANAGAVDVYLTSSGVSLNNVSPNFSDVTAGSSTGYTSMSDGTYELRVAGTTKKSDLRFSLSSIKLTNKEIVTLIITETPGGYLVNVMALPQQGSLTTYTNPYARARAVIGLSSASSVTAAVGSTTLLSSAPKTAVGTYQVVPVGSDAVTLTVDGTSESVPAKSLAAGQDYTFLVYGSSSSVQESWIEDSNIPPASGYSSVRLVNAMSASGDPVSLSIDFESVATDVALGGASSYDTSVVSTSTGTVTATDYSTSATLYSQTSATLASGGVYTMFMFGSASSPIGELYKDR